MPVANGGGEGIFFAIVSAIVPPAINCSLEIFFRKRIEVLEFFRISLVLQDDPENSGSVRESGIIPGMELPPCDVGGEEKLELELDLEEEGGREKSAEEKGI